MKNSRKHNYSYIIIFMIYIVYFGIWPIFISLKSILPAIPITGVHLYIVLLILLALFIICKLSMINHKILIDKHNIMVFLLLTTIIIKLILGYLQYKQTYFFYNDYILKFIVTNAIDMLILYLIGKNFYLIINEKHTHIRNITFFVYFIYSLAIYYLNFKYHINTDGNGVFISFYLNGFVDANNAVNYLSIGDNFAILSFFILNSTVKYKKKIFLIANSIFVLYLIGSRTSLIVFILCILFCTALDFFKIKSTYKKIAIVLTASILIAASLLFLPVVQKNSLNFSNNRMVSLLTNNREKDYSYEERKRLFEIGVEQVKRNWFKGQMFAEYEIGVGEYIHNILSYWQEYGIIVFLFLLYLSSKVFVKNVFNSFKLSNRNNEYLVMNSMYIIICSFISRAYVNPLIWFALSLNTTKVNNDNL